jgi:hypothetical protein
MTENNLNNSAVSEIPSWFERKFEFIFPVEHYPILCVRLRGALDFDGRFPIPTSARSRVAGNETRYSEDPTAHFRAQVDDDLVKDGV